MMIATGFAAISGLDQGRRPAKGSAGLYGYRLEPQGKQPTMLKSCDNIGRELIFDKADAVAQHELALFQPLHLQEIRARHIVQGLDGDVEIAMLLLEARQLRPKL